MRIPEPDIRSIELAIAELERDGARELEVPTPATFPGVTSFCAEAALLQFVVTWARSKDTAENVLFSTLDATSTNFEATLQKQLGIPHFLAAWVLGGKLYDESRSLLKRREAKGYAAFLDAMDNFEFQRTHDTTEGRANLICVQGSKREYIRPFYEQYRTQWRVRPEGDIRVVIQDILMQLAPRWPGGYVREVSEPLAHLMRELVENSDWWARVDQKGVEYDKGVRAVTVRLRDIDDDNLEMFAGGNSHIQAYLLHNLTTHPKVQKDVIPSSRDGQARKLSFIELSMVDSGPGLARRWLANRPQNKRSVNKLDEIPLHEEEDAVIECFKKWRTSSGNALRGVGLFSVGSLLRKRNGFLRLRTGRLGYLFGTQSAIGDIELQLRRAEPHDDYVRLDDGTHVFLHDGQMIFFLRPWTQEQVGAVEGTAYSILLPV
ncbi:hypothetical protein JG536_28120 (plasmid) [Burkholderia ambifaria]|uniref:hypothetical protein n=1 Tax=Burkholderia ambifaria TaxID=152480 RepID=UPI00158A8E55|nr:hypothetical protein [Burkholderia ambifaria]QQJ96416.1 hypothetical protein JG536_12415 [Burkholderia ambifaria]QQK01065.1 hypothetical protein JG536_28120 [Burkholderia ambifaria]